MEKKIAIRGHKTRGRDVIQALEGMGGTNEIGFDGNDSNYGYYIRHDLMISLEKLDKPPLGESYSLYTIEEYEEYMKNLEANTDCAKKLVEEEKKLSDESWRYKNVFDHSQYPQSFGCPEGYIFKDENGNVINATKVVLEKKKKEYPKTYEECCKILGFLNVDLCFNADYSSFDASKEQWKRLGLMNQFYQLLICRDAYWKIAGEEMGLGKPWEPDWTSENPKYCICVSSNKIVFDAFIKRQQTLSFPTEEMRDTFYENFKELINSCKELL